MGLMLIVLTAISLIVLIVGLVWWLAGSGKTTRRSGPEVGAEIMGGMGNDDPEMGATLLDKSAFAGKGVAVEREAAVSYAEVKRMVRGRQWREALPPVLAIAGLYGLVVFGALALWVAMDDKLVATIIAGVALFTMARIAYDFARSQA
jgi:hypothetical protein